MVRELSRAACIQGARGALAAIRFGLIGDAVLSLRLVDQAMVAQATLVLLMAAIITGELREADRQLITPAASVTGEVTVLQDPVRDPSTAKAAALSSMQIQFV
jgi:hypothetical protein